VTHRDSVGLKKRLILALAIAAVGATSAAAQEGVAATLYNIPRCQCCDSYATYLRANGFDVKVVESRNVSQIRKQEGVPASLEGCHTTVVGGYVVEGHVPISAIKRLLG
jgi:hypothetical protein